VAFPKGVQRDPGVMGEFDKDQISRTKGSWGETLGFLPPYFREDLLKLG
jgi:hypothetical protein